MERERDGRDAAQGRIEAGTGVALRFRTREERRTQEPAHALVGERRRGELDEVERRIHQGERCERRAERHVEERRRRFGGTRAAAEHAREDARDLRAHLAELRHHDRDARRALARGFEALPRPSRSMLELLARRIEEQAARSARIARRLGAGERGSGARAGREEVLLLRRGQVQAMKDDQRRRPCGPAREARGDRCGQAGGIDEVVARGTPAIVRAPRGEGLRVLPALRPFDRPLDAPGMGEIPRLGGERRGGRHREQPTVPAARVHRFLPEERCRRRREEPRKRPAALREKRLLVAALHEGAEGEDVRRFPGAASGGEPVRVELRLQGLGEPGVGREDRDLRGVALGEAGEKRVLREGLERVRHDASIIGRAPRFLQL